MDKQEEKKNKIITGLRETRDYNQKAIDEMKKVINNMPYLKEAVGVIDNEIEAIDKVPSKYFIDFPSEASKLIEANQANACQFYGKVHQMYTDVSSMTTSTSATFSSASFVSNWMDNYKDRSTEIENAANKLREALSNRTIREKTKNEIRALLSKLLNNNDNTYENILEEIGRAKVDIQRLEGVAFSMRTLLEKVKGELKLKLKTQVGITKNKILPAIAEEFIDSSKSSPSYHTYMHFINQYNIFMDKLTNIGKMNIKNTEGIDKLEIEFDNTIRALLLPLKDKL